MKSSLITRSLAFCSVAVLSLAGCQQGSLDTGSSQPSHGSQSGGSSSPLAHPNHGPLKTLRIEREIDRAPTYFTQGLEVDSDRIYESTGQYGSSIIEYRPLAGGAPVARQALPADQFGEGLTVTSDRVWHVVWRKGIAYARDKNTLQQLAFARYQGEGWGLCSTMDRVVMSNGSARLTFRDLTTFAETGFVDVTGPLGPVGNLNELECVGNSVYANEWKTNFIHHIDLRTGKIIATIDASALNQPRALNPDAVLNGIATANGGQTLLVTGKLWPKIYEVTVVD